MSRGSFLMGTVRGKLGEMVLARSKGQQVQRAYIRNVANPRSNAQVKQRALFVNAVKFFTRGNQALFKFAFEDKKSNESDYNAFMRANVKNGIVMSKAQFDNYGYPAVGKYLVTKGSLADFECEVIGGQGTAYTGVPMSASDNPTTIGEVADILITGGMFDEGDIITILTINSYTDGEQAPVINPTDAYNTRWEIKQFVLRRGDERLLSEFGLRVINEGTRTPRGLAFVMNSIGDGDNGAAFTMIHSRNTANGLKVSTQVLALDEVAENIYLGGNTQTYIDQVIASWKATQSTTEAEYILQGSLAPDKVSNTEDFFPGYPYYRTATRLANGGSVVVAAYPTSEDFDMTRLSTSHSDNVTNVVLSQEGSNLVATITYTESASSEQFGVQIKYGGAEICNIQGSTKPVVNPAIVSVVINGVPITTNTNVGDVMSFAITTANVEDGSRVVVTSNGSYDVGATLDIQGAKVGTITSNSGTIEPYSPQLSISQHIYVTDSANVVLVKFPYTFINQADEP